jgi:hypothetical protein
VQCFGRKVSVMRNKIILFSLLVFLSVLLAFVNFVYPNPLLEKGIYTFAAVGIIYFVFRNFPRRASPQENQSINDKILIKESSFDLKLSQLLCSSDGYLDC